jgi:hypothetical protein
MAAGSSTVAIKSRITLANASRLKRPCPGRPNTKAKANTKRCASPWIKLIIALPFSLSVSDPVNSLSLTNRSLRGVRLAFGFFCMIVAPFSWLLVCLRRRFNAFSVNPKEVNSH